MVAPKTKTIIGEITGISTLTTPKGELILVSIMDAKGVSHTVSTSPNYWKAVGAFFQPESVVTTDVEERIANVTEYTDKAGKVQKHTSSGLNISKISGYSKSRWAKEAGADFQARDVQIITAVEESRVDAVSAYLAATYGK